MRYLIDDINKALDEGKDVAEELKGRKYKQLTDLGHIIIAKFDKKTNILYYCFYEWGDCKIESMSSTLQNLPKFYFIESKKDCKDSLNYIPNPSLCVDIGD